MEILLGNLRSASVIRFIVTMIAAPLAAKAGLDAAQTGSLTEWLYAGAMGAVTVGPMVWAQIIRPSDKAMEVAKVADKIIAGEKTTQAVVTTPAGTPNIVVKPEK